MPHIVYPIVSLPFFFSIVMVVLLVLCLRHLELWLQDICDASGVKPVPEAPYSSNSQIHCLAGISSCISKMYLRVFPYFDTQYF